MLNVAQKYALDRTAVMVTSLMNYVKIMSQQKGSELEGWNTFFEDQVITCIIKSLKKIPYKLLHINTGFCKLRITR